MCTFLTGVLLKQDTSGLLNSITIVSLILNHPQLGLLNILKCF